MKLTIGSIVMVVMLVALCSLPMVEAATNSYTKTLTTTSELSNGAAYNGYTISGDRIVASGYGEYSSPAFTAVNLTSASITVASADYDDTVYDYGWLYSNTLWLNSTDARHNTGGHAHYAIRYPFNSNDGGYIRDMWTTHDLSGSSQDATLGSGTIVTPTYKPYQNYIDFDGTDDYTRTTYPFDYDAGYWYTSAMIKADGTYGCIIGISDAETQAIIMLEYVDATADYLQVAVRDQNGNVAYGVASGSITPNSWHFVVLRADGTNIYLYVDGTLQATVDMTYNSSSQLNLDYIQLGGIYYEGNNILDWAGCMDEYRFHAGFLPTAECSNSGLMGTYMWACVNGNNPTKSSSYQIAGAGDSLLYTQISGYTTGGYYINDLSMTWTNTKPNIIAVWPKDDLTYDTDPTVVLTVNADDADISYEDFIAAFFYVDGEYEGSASRTTNGEIQLNIGTFTGGYHTWAANVADSWDGVTGTGTEGFYVLSTLYIRDEQDFENTIDDATVTLNFYTENTSTTKTSSDGTVDLSGLPVQDILVTASADGYYDRKTIITSLYDAQNIYMINENASVIYNTFKLNTQSISYPVTDYWIDIQKPMNGSVDTVFSSYFGFDGSCGTYLITSEVYRLVIHSPDGTDITYGWLYPDPDGVMDITITSGAGVDMVTDWLTTTFTVDDEADTISWYYLSEESIDTATFTVKENNETVQEYSVDATSNTFVYNSDSSKHNYQITLSITTDDGDEYEVVKMVTLNQDNLDPFPSGYPDWFKQAIVSAVAIMCILAFSSYRVDVGCLMGAGVFCTAYMFDWFPIGRTVIFSMIMITVAAIVRFKRKQDRVW